LAPAELKDYRTKEILMARYIESVWAASLAAIGAACLGGAASMWEESPALPGPRANPSFVNWETPQVHPIDRTPDGTKLLVANTADNRIEILSLAGGIPTVIGYVAVGLDPVSVRPRTNNEVWVVNHVSDTVSVVDLTTRNVVRTLDTLDEPCDVVFAGSPVRAFVTCSQANTVRVFDPANLSAAPVDIAIDGEDPRSLAVSPDGSTVYAAIFESGNRSTLLGGGSSGTGTIAFPPNAVSDVAGPYGGVNPPPNNGAVFNPPVAPGNSPPIKVGLIVKKNAAGQWMDDNAHDWTSMVSGVNAGKSGRVIGWDMPDRDLAVINASTLSVSYATGLMNLCMSVGVNPATGAITVIGTEATNEVRFEPVLKGRFTRVNMASVNPTTLAKTVVDLNPHLDYLSSSIPASERFKSIGDPREIVWNNAGTKGYVAGMGSNNVIVVNSAGGRAGLSPTIPVGEGPTGISLDEARGQMYVLNRFEGTISVVNLATESQVAIVPMYDPTPPAIKLGRKHLYDTHLNSGLGQISCASCHVDARMDRLAWDLGDPGGPIAALTDLNLGFGLPGLSPGTTNPAFAPFHPMKGPMTTQTMQDIVGKEPHHWRGDRSGVEAFGPAFVGLQGKDFQPNALEMQDFENFLATITFPPNPFRTITNGLPTSLPLPGHLTTGRFGVAGLPLPNGNAVNGLAIYRSTSRRVDRGAFACVTCHTLPTGAGPDMKLVGSVYQPIAVGPKGEHHLGVVSVDGSTNVTIKIPQIRNMAEKSGSNFITTSSNAGFGFIHDGSVDSIERFVNEPAFNLTSNQETADMVALMLAFSGSDLPQGLPNTPLEPPGPLSLDTHAAVGKQTTLVSQASASAAQLALISTFVSLADSGKVGLVVKGVQSGQQRGWAYVGASTFQSDRAGQTISASALLAAAALGSELTYTVVPKGAETRIGIDHNLNGCLDSDERVICACPSDFNQDGFVNGDDFDAYALAFELGYPTADFNGDEFVNADDYDAFVDAFFAGC